MAVEGSALSSKVDPNVKIPASVKAAGERSDELAKQAAEAKKNRSLEVDAPVVIAQPTPPNPGVVVANFDPNNPQPPGEPSMPQDQQNWEHQFNSLKGRYDRAEQDNRRLAGQIGDLQRLITAMNTVPPPQSQQPPQEGSGVRFTGPITGRSPSRRITDKEVADFGADLIDVMGRRAMEVADAVFLPQISQYEGRLAQLERQVGGVRQTVEYDAQTRMYHQLDRDIPNWKEINSHPDFVSWLQMPDPLSGQIRHSLLGQAYNSNQANRVTEFFRRFLSDQGQHQGNGASLPAVNAPAPQLDLLALAAPGRAKTGQSQVPGDKPVFSVADVKRFYTESANGHYAGREEEYNKIQQAIFEAGREGRIQR